MGLPPSEFYKMTPREFVIYNKGYFAKKEADQKEQIGLEYANALWTIQWLGKHKPKPLDKILDIKTEKKKMTSNEMLEQVKLLNQKFGGEIKLAKND